MSSPFRSMGFYPPYGLSSSSFAVDDASSLAQPVYRKASSASTASSSSSPSTAWIGHASPNADTDGSSNFSASSPPASDDGLGNMAHDESSHARREDWDLLSEMLVDESMLPSQGLRTQSFVGGNVLGGYDVFGAPPPPHKPLYDQQPPPHHHQHQQPTMPFAPPPFQQNQKFQQNQPFHPHQQNQQNQHHQHQLHRASSTSSSSSSPSLAVMPVGYLDALLEQDDALLAAQQTATTTANKAKTAATTPTFVGSPQTPDLFPPQPFQPPSSSPSSSSSDSDGSPLAKKSRKTASPSSISLEEAKKLKRRSQIASSVQRHREKKKCLVATLKHDLASLTSHLASLRTERKALHANNETLVAYEESAITQRRKRKQSEQQNAQLKTALFHQTCFLMGMRSIMTNIPAPRELHIHDWLHSYTVLSGQRDARRKEYAACFSESKVDLAKQIVLRETDVFAARLTLKNPYFSEVRVLHDGTDVLHDEGDVWVKRELTEATEFAVPGAGQVVKKYTSMFLFEERGNCTLEAFQHVALEATKAVGVFWPSPGYESHALDTMVVEEDNNDDASSSQLIFSDLHGSMAIIDDQHTNADQDVQLEARMICRVAYTAHDTTIAWDYADKDELYPITGDQAIRRDSCGAAIVRREPGGKISFRSVCLKMFGPLDSHETASSDVRALTQRRISLQASEIERQNQKCTRSVYESLAAVFTRPVGTQQ